jgi:hypothetical protein
MRQVFIRTPSCFTIAALVVGALPGRAQTWIQWNSTEGENNHYYALTPTATNWNAAQKLAVSWGGTLATVTSSNEQNFINTTFLTGKFEHLPLWIGLCKSPAKGPFSGKLGPLQVQVRLQPNSDFHWVTGEALSYTNWKSGEPSDTPPGEDYVAINWEHSDSPSRGLKGDWNDTPLNGTTGYGGKTDGPYFGLVEREAAPNRPAKASFRRYAVPIALMAALAVVLAFCIARCRRYESPVA